MARLRIIIWGEPAKFVDAIVQRLRAANSDCKILLR